MQRAERPVDERNRVRIHGAIALGSAHLVAHLDVEKQTELKLRVVASQLCCTLQEGQHQLRFLLPLALASNIGRGAARGSHWRS